MRWGVHSPFSVGLTDTLVDCPGEGSLQQDGAEGARSGRGHHPVVLVHWGSQAQVLHSGEGTQHHLESSVGGSG